jgi:SAM-dependent methyltransferase
VLRRITPVCALATCLFAQSQADALRDQYNRTYANPGEWSTFNQEPNAFMVETLRTWKPGRALDVGMGQGRNAIWLAKQGWNVTGFDLSDSGVKLAQQNAARAGVAIKAIVANADEFEFGVDQWDLVVLSYVPFASYRDRLIRSLKPGGVVVVEFLHEDTRRVRLFSGGFKDNELIHAFPGFRVLRYEDVWAKQDWGVQLDGNNRLVRLLAQKPAPRPPTCEWERKTYSTGGEVCWGAMKLRCSQGGWQRAGACSVK